MSDQRTNILSAIDSTLTTLRASGGVLEDIKSHSVLFTSADGPPDYGTYAPLLIVMAPDVESEDLTLCGNMLKTTMPVYFSIFTENNGDTRSQIASALIDVVGEQFRKNTLGYSSFVHQLSKNYNGTSITEFSDKWTGRSEIVLEYMYIDGRDGMYNTAPNPSGILILDGTESIPVVAYTTIRVKSDGGAVEMTALPTFSPAPKDGQIFIVVGQSDTDTVEFPDNSNTPGSALRMKHARNMVLGLNDSLVFQYDQSQALYINITRSDTY